MQVTWQRACSFTLLLRILALKSSAATGLGPLPFATICGALIFVAAFAMNVSVFPFGFALFVSIAITAITAIFLWRTFASPLTLAEMQERRNAIQEQIIELRAAQRRNKGAIVERFDAGPNTPPIAEPVTASPAIAAQISVARGRASVAQRLGNILVRSIRGIGAMLNLIPQFVGVFVLSLFATRDTKRPQNYCIACDHTWYPRGIAISRACPACSSPEVGLADFRGAKAVGWLCCILAIGAVALLSNANLRDANQPLATTTSPDGVSPAPDLNVADKERTASLTQQQSAQQVANNRSPDLANFRGGNEHPIAAPPPATSLYEVSKIIDGDTIEVLREGKTLRIELAMVDCPEIDQPLGEKAFRFTSNGVKGHSVNVTAVRHSFASIEGIVVLPNGKILNEELVRSGLAWIIPGTKNGDALAEFELIAKSNAYGIWGEAEPIKPWEWRAGKRARPAGAAKTPPRRSAGSGANLQVPPTTRAFWLNTSTGVRHNSSCKHYGSTTRGRSCSAYEGTACKICGG